VLVCEDEPALRELVRVSLEEAYAFVEARDGEEALEQLRVHRPDVLILDLMLPRLNGLEVLAELQGGHESEGVVTLVLTAQPEFGQRALELGADRVISKPFLPDDLAAAVRELLQQRP
jgi:DNA-binding response OmpR family regulator